MRNLSHCPKLLFLAISLIFTLAASGSAATDVGEITGEIDLSLKQQRISAKLKYVYVAGEVPEPEIKLYLNEKFTVSRVKCRICTAFNFDQKARRFPTLTVTLKQPLPPRERLPIEIDYEGDISESYHKEHDFLELGLDWCWYPSHKNIGQFYFLYRLTIKTDVPDFQMVSNGRTKRKGDRWLIESKVADKDIDVVLANKLIVKS